MNSQSIVGWIVALLIGAAIGWWLGRRGGKAPGLEKEPLDAKLQNTARELDAARAEISSQANTLVSLKNELVNTSTELKSREIELGALEERIKALESLEAEIEAKKSEADALNIEIHALRGKLADVVAARAATEIICEPPASTPAQPDANLQVEIAALKEALAAKEDEIAVLLARVKELAPLKLQIKDRDLRLRGWDAKYAEAVKTIQSKDEEITALSRRIEEQAVTETPAAEEAETRGVLMDRIAELESLLTAQTGYEARIKELTDQHTFNLGEKDSQISDLRAQISDAERELELAQTADADHHGALRDRDAAISLLQLRVKELEPLGSELAERDAKLRRLEENFQLAHAAEQLSREKDAEIERLQARIGDLETSSAPTAPLALPETGGSSSRELEAKYQAVLAEKDALLAEKNAELARLQSLIAANGTDVRARADADEAKVQELEAEHRAEISDRDAEINKLRARIQELEPLHAQIFARDARLIELDARVRGLTSEKERELNRLNAQIAELVPAGERADAAEAKLRELERRHQSLLNNKDVEISGLRVKVAGLENDKAQLEERLSKARVAENEI